MTLKAQAETALLNLSSSSQAAQTIAVTDGGQELTAKLTGLDALALAFEHITLASNALADAPIERLKVVADALAKRLTYLLEPISPIEVDADQCIVQMRSNPPQRDDNGTRYYELLVRRGGELGLRRYQRQSAGERRNISAQITREVFLRLVGDLSDAAK
jgi:hypothetical protein